MAATNEELSRLVGELNHRADSADPLADPDLDRDWLDGTEEAELHYYAEGLREAAVLVSGLIRSHDVDSH